MHRIARQTAIMAEISSTGSCTVTNLARRLDVSGETIRRDIKRMALQGLVRKVHGGATLPGPLHEASFEQRMNENAAAKEAIARSAANHVSDGETLSFDTGTTTAYVARMLATRGGLTVITNSLDIARTMAGNNQVLMAGGELHAALGATLGGATIEFVSQFRVRTAFLSAGAIDAEDALMDFELEEAQFSRALIEAAERVVVVADHSKFGKRALVRACELSRIDMLITDAPPPPPLAEKLDKAGVVVEVAGN